MKNTVLLGVDGSDSSSRAIEFAAELALSAKSHLLVAYIIEWSPFTFNTPEENEVRHKRREEELSRAQSEVIAPIIKSLERREIDVEGIVRHGKPVVALAEIASTKEASQIVVGRRGESKLGGLLFGSISAGLLQVSPVPVTVVP